VQRDNPLSVVLVAGWFAVLDGESGLVVIVLRYNRYSFTPLPPLSVETLQLKDALVSSRSVFVKFVGAVGLVESYTMTTSTPCAEIFPNASLTFTFTVREPSPAGQLVTML